MGKSVERGEARRKRKGEEGGKKVEWEKRVKMMRKGENLESWQIHAAIPTVRILQPKGQKIAPIIIMEIEAEKSQTNGGE